MNGETSDEELLYVGDLIVKHCTKYVYLGSPFTCDGSVTTFAKEHTADKL